MSFAAKSISLRSSLSTTGDTVAVLSLMQDGTGQQNVTKLANQAPKSGRSFAVARLRAALTRDS